MLIVKDPHFLPLSVCPNSYIARQVPKKMIFPWG